MDLIPRHMVNLTSPLNSGVNLLYDVRARTITAWNHFDDGPVDEGDDNDADGEYDFARSLRERVPRGMGDVQNQLVQWVLWFLKLENVPKTFFNNANIAATIGEHVRDEDKALRGVFEEAGWDMSVVKGIEERHWNRDGTALAARLEEARLKAKRNFDVETYTRLHKDWMRKFDLDG